MRSDLSRIPEFRRVTVESIVARYRFVHRFRIGVIEFTVIRYVDDLVIWVEHVTPSGRFLLGQY